MPFARNGGVRIHYEAKGNDKFDTLVLQHGFYGSCEDWFELGYVGALKEKYQVVTVDARGHGQSDKPHDPAQYTPYLRALDVITVLDELKIEKCSYMGFSMGGWIAFGLMRWFPGRFHSFILDAVHPYANDMAGIREGIETMDEWIPQIPTSEERKRRMLGCDRVALRAAVSAPRADNSDVLRSLKVPCLMLDGERDEINCLMKESALLSKQIEFITIPDEDHDGSLTNGGFVIPRVREFLSLLWL